MALNKKQILAKYAVRRYDEVDDIRIQSLTELEQSKLTSMWGTRFNQTNEVDARMRRELLSLCIVDENGERCFDPSDVEAMAELDGGMVERVYERCRKLCGMDDMVDSEKLGKKLDETTG